MGRFLPINIPVAAGDIIPYPSLYGGKTVGYSGFRYVLPSSMHCISLPHLRRKTAAVGSQPVGRPGCRSLPEPASPPSAAGAGRHISIPHQQGSGGEGQEGRMLPAPLRSRPPAGLMWETRDDGLPSLSVSGEF
jgi:hypothetical protein